MATGEAAGLASSIFDELAAIFLKIKNHKNDQLKCEKSATVDSCDPLHKTGVLGIMRLRQLNRLSNVGCKERRERTQERKGHVDGYHLQLQNLRYEVMHLQKEITNCLEFKSKHEDIELQSEDQLCLSNEELASKNSHTLMLKRLEFELEERKRLSIKRTELECLIKTRQESQTQLEKKLSSLRPSLETLKSTAVTLQEFFGPSLVWEREQYQLAHSLPLPLYMLYVQLLGYGKTQDDKISFAIEGDKDEVASFQYLMDHHSTNDEEEGEGEHTGNKRRKKRKGVTSSTVEPSCCKAFPLSVTLTISDEAGTSVVMSFHHLPFFNVTCATVTSITLAKSLQPDKSYYIDKTSFLHCLYEGDSGRTSPNALVSSQIRKFGGDNFSSAVRKYGFPFKWVQHVCGVVSPTDSEQPLQTDPECAARSVVEFVTVIRHRLECQQSLARQLGCLDKLQVSLDSSPCPVLIRWSQVTVQELQKLDSNGGLIKFNFQERVNRFFLATFKSNEARVHVIMCVTPNYPTTTPVMSIVIEPSDKQQDVYGIQHKNIEAEVNIHYFSKVPEPLASSDILLGQVRRVRECLDSYTSNNITTRRGKGRLLTYSQD